MRKSTTGGASDEQCLVVARHGESEANAALVAEQDPLYYSVSSSDPVVPLTAAGAVQAQLLGVQLAAVFPPMRPLSRIYHTGFRRVVQTADAIDAALGYPVERVVDERLNKRNYGLFWNLTRHGVKVLHPDEWESYLQEGELHYRPPGGENFLDVFQRVDQFIDSELAEASGNVLVVTHLMPALCFRRRFEALGDSEVMRHYEERLVQNADALIYRRRSSIEQWQPCSVHAPACLHRR